MRALFFRIGRTVSRTLCGCLRMRIDSSLERETVSDVQRSRGGDTRVAYARTCLISQRDKRVNSCIPRSASVLRKFFPALGETRDREWFERYGRLATDDHRCDDLAGDRSELEAVTAARR